MAYNAALNTVYNHYLTTYAPKSSQYDTHKKSELRGIYNSIVKLNKESPLYLLDDSKDSSEFAVGIKENARLLHNTIASLGGLDDQKMFNKKAAYSSNSDIASAVYIGDLPDDSETTSFNIEVTALASKQIHEGRFLPSEGKIGLPADAYSFDMTINDLGYEFQYNIREGETNKDLQERLSRLINNANIGIDADVIDDGKGNSALRLSSTNTGLKPNKDTIFRVSDDKTSKRTGTVDYLGMNQVISNAANAEFLLNGEPRTASSNHFTVEKAFELTLNSISPEGEATQIGLKTDLDSLTENVSNLVSGYNSFIEAANRYLESHPKSGRLVSEMELTSQYYQHSLNNIGITFEENGQMDLDQDKFQTAIMSSEDQQVPLLGVRDFANSILRKAKQISLNPMEYVDKTVVAYKNPGHNLATPYHISNYSGMLFNSYC